MNKQASGKILILSSMAFYHDQLQELSIKQASFENNTINNNKT